MQASRLTPRASVHLDMIRGVAALAVLIGHVRGMFFVDLQSLGAGRPGLVLSALYGATGLGHEAVMVFFVLSGFFIGGSVLSASSRWSWKPYAVNRLSRLYVVLIPALVLTALVDYLAHGLPAGSFYYDHPIVHFNDVPYADRAHLSTFLGNLAFLQTIAVSPFGSNSPLWSLANEFWYYLLFPLVALAFSVRVAVRQRFMYGGILLACCAWLPSGILAAFAIWLFGVAVHALPSFEASRRPALARVLAGGAAVSLVAVLMLLKLHPLRSGGSDFLVGAAAAALLYVVVRIQWRAAAPSRSYHWLATKLSKCSYSVYAVHFPIVMLVRVAVGSDAWQPTVANLATGSAMAVGIFLCGAAFAQLTEARTETVRRRVMKWLERVEPRPAVVVTP